MSGILAKKAGNEVILYIAIPTTDTTHSSTNPRVVYVRVPDGQTLKQIVDAL